MRTAMFTVLVLSLALATGCGQSETPNAAGKGASTGPMTITADHVADVRRAITKNDRAALARHGRLLGVIGERILATTPTADEKARIEALLKTTFQAYVEVVTRCD